MATPQNSNGIYNNIISNAEPTNLCCYTATYPRCITKNIFLVTTTIETEGENAGSGSLVNIASTLRDISASVNLFALDSAISPSILPALTTPQRNSIINSFKAIIA